jgi:hypothetical protein
VVWCRWSKVGGAVGGRLYKRLLKDIGRIWAGVP